MIEPGALLVMSLYGLALYVILVVAPRLSHAFDVRKPWYRDVRFWASFVAITQIVVYALFG
jgi:hypothetical protein